MKIAKFYCAVLAAILFAGVSSVQAQSFEQGKVIISAGYGFGNFTKAILKTYSSNLNYKVSSFGPAFAKFEYAVSDKVGIGLNVAHISTKADFNETDNSKTSIDWVNTSILGRINLHFANSEKFDAYWGAGIGYRFGKWTIKNDDPDFGGKYDTPNVLPFGFETTIGARYYFIPSVGIYAELGIAKAPIQFGLSAAF